MREDFEVKIYGVRGSLQAVGINGGSFGANTSCVLVRCGDTRIVLDCGSGAFILGEELLNEPENDLTVLISHTHLDHILGVPFFRPLFESRFSISFYGAVQCGRNIIEQIGCMMSPPLWPVGVSDFKASVVHREVVPGKGFTLENGIIVETLLSNHPNVAVLYKITYKGRSFVYGLDYEHCDKSSYGFDAFIKGCDLVLYDASYSNEEYALHRGYGHSTWETGMALAERCGVKRMIMSHLGFYKTDSELEALDRKIQSLNSHCALAREGEVFIL